MASAQSGEARNVKIRREPGGTGCGDPDTRETPHGRAASFLAGDDVKRAPVGRAAGAAPHDRGGRALDSPDASWAMSPPET